ncbi:P-loop NTPase fold protein [uncultured Draconibacterium sp.]|uniref:P-loop NTPase fold protein n=1 Tax=uncultured Draconibacterium sp. TaxID=1573823 RepID=UPI0025E721FF|nr:P-loop NTPase fold protein [uncultured Draconibacterium sp.]
MHIDFINKTSFFNKNQDYINYIRGLADIIFQPENIGSIGYIQSKQENFSHTRYKQVGQTKNVYEVLPSEKLETTFVHKCLSTEGLGPFEQTVLSNILNSDYSTIVITGALGSGKSSLVDHILDYMSNNIKHENCNNYSLCKSHDTLYISIDFIKGFNSNKSEEILNEFDAKLYNSFTHVIRKIFSEKQLLEEFIKYSTSYTEDILVSFKFLGLKIRQEKSWDTLTTEDKLEQIIDWLHNRFGSEFPLSYKNTVLAEMINFVGDKFPERLNGCFIMVYDNIDRFSDEVQNEVINRLLGVSQIIKAKTLICSRLTTFGKISGNSSYAFGVVENAGHLPVSIIIQRIAHYIENKDKQENYINLRSVIPTIYLTAFDNRIKEIYRLLTKENSSRLYEVLDALSGLSIRRGLHLSRRLLINYVSDYLSIPEEDMLISGILCKNNENAQMTYDDRRITNIFLSHHNLSNSLTNIRILGILHTYRTKDRPIRLNELLHYLNLYGINSQDEIYHSIDVLSSVRKRLISLNGISKFNKEMLFNDTNLKNSFVQLTWAGNKYYSNLCENLQYLQDCFGIINWSKLALNGNGSIITQHIEEKKIEMKDNVLLNDSTFNFLKDSLMENISGDITEIIPKTIDSNNFQERIKLLRKGLYIYLYEDIYQSLVYEKNVFNPENLRQNNHLLFINSLSTVDMIATISRSVYRISISKNLSNRAVYGELLNWKSLLRLSYYWNYIIFKSNSRLSSAIMKDFEKI